MVSKMSKRLHVNTHYCRILIKLEFARQIFGKRSSISFIKLRPLEAELIHAERQTDGRTDVQTDMTKLVVAFRNFANAPKNCKHQLHILF